MKSHYVCTNLIVPDMLLCTYQHPKIWFLFCLHYSFGKLLKTENSSNIWVSYLGYLVLTNQQLTHSLMLIKCQKFACHLYSCLILLRYFFVHLFVFAFIRKELWNIIKWGIFMWGDWMKERGETERKKESKKRKKEKEGRKRGGRENKQTYN